MELPSFLHDLTGERDKPSMEHANEIFNMLEVLKVRKRQVLLPLGDVADSIYIIKSGILKGSIKDEKGKMNTVIFVADENVMTSVYSFINQKPSDLQIECLESGEILCFKYQDFEYMSKLYPGLSIAFHKIMLNKYHDLLDRKSRMITQDATTRYLKFIEHYGGVSKRIPLKEIASFLGIRQQSLSRLRGTMKEVIN